MSQAALITSSDNDRIAEHDTRHVQTQSILSRKDECAQEHEGALATSAKQLYDKDFKASELKEYLGT